MAEMHILGSRFDRKFRQELNENFGNLSDSFTNAVDIVAKEAFDLVVDSAKIEWLSPVNTFSELDTTYPEATEGKTAMVRDTDKVYRKDGEGWKEIQEIDATAVNEVDSRLSADISLVNQSTAIREVANKPYRKKVVNQFPLRFPDYDAIVSSEEVTYIYPQSFTIDWETREIFFLYSPNGGTSSKRWVVVYDVDNATYKSSFSAGNAGGEGIVVKYEDATRYLYVKTTGQSLGKFALNELPENLTTLSPQVEFNVGLYYEFSYRNGTWLVEQSGAVLGNYVRRTLFSLYDDAFNLKGNINFSIADGGFNVGDYVMRLPKRQGIALGDGYILQSIGGAALKSDVSDNPYKYQGIRTYSQSGNLVTEGIVHPDKMMSQMEGSGILCERIENEGVHVSPDGNVYTLFVHQGRFVEESNESGLILFEEFSDDLSAIDFSPSAVFYTPFDEVKLSSGIYPRSADGNMYNPLTGEKLDSFNKICNFMSQADIPKFSFYSSAVSVIDINNTPIPPTTHVIINNSNNETFFVEFLGDPNNKRFIIYGPPGAKQQKEIFYQGQPPLALTLGSGVTNYFEHYPTTVKKDSEGIVVLDGMVNVPNTRPVVITTLPAGYRPGANLSFTVALSASSAGGYGVITVQTNGEVRLVYSSSNVTYTGLNGIVFKTI